jgi:hypothetical protein
VKINNFKLVGLGFTALTAFNGVPPRAQENLSGEAFTIDQIIVAAREREEPVPGSSIVVTSIQGDSSQKVGILMSTILGPFTRLERPLRMALDLHILSRFIV